MGGERERWEIQLDRKLGMYSHILFRWGIAVKR